MVLDKYIDVFDTKLSQSMNMEPVKLNFREGNEPGACHSCRPTPAHYRGVAQKLVDFQIDVAESDMHKMTFMLNQGWFSLERLSWETSSLAG